MSQLHRSVSIFCTAFLSLLLLSVPAGMAQDAPGERGFEGAVVKAGGFSPAAGVSWSLGSSNSLRLIGFFSTDFEESGPNNRLILDLSYLQDTDWLDSESTVAYWGANLNVHLRDHSLLAPGGLVGISHTLTDRFSVFGEAGLNVTTDFEFLIGILSMHNTGIGIQVRL